MSIKRVRVGDIDCGSDQLFLISGPCVIEEESLMLRTAERLKQIAEKLGIPLVFKSSFSKDNRSSLEYYQGPGLEEGLRILEKVKRTFDLPLLTDIHYPTQAARQPRSSTSCRFRLTCACRASSSSQLRRRGRSSTSSTASSSRPTTWPSPSGRSR